MNEIELRHINFKYTNGPSVFENFNLSVEPGSFIFLLGSNGSGKSSLLKLVLGAVTPNNGAVFFRGEEVKSIKRRSKLIGYIPQNYGLDNEMYVDDILKYVGSLHQLSSKELRDRRAFLITALDLNNIIDRKVKTLSGGQKQLVNIAVGLIHDPDILLIDEPFVGLDYGIKSKIISFLNSINKTIICASHDIEMAENNASKILLINNGVTEDYRAPKEIIEDNPYYLEEIDFKEQFEAPWEFSSEISSSKHHNRLILSCPNKKELIDEVDSFKQEFHSKISSTRIGQNNLQSTLVGFNNFSLNDKKGEKKIKRKK